jgi:outer membrane receptor protein involved in Fe transport
MRNRISLLLLLLAAPSAAEPAVRVRGFVRDTAGAPVAVAIVTLRGGGVEARTASDLEGRFEVDWQGPDEVTVTVDAKGYANRRQPLRVGEAAGSGVTFVMAPLAFGEEVTVTGGARRPGTGESAASVTVLTREELASSPSPALDDALRQVPGFALFRRSGSRVANPTAQGVTLRGLGGSGASRVIVLDDGIPLNDPFGGWVYWNRTPEGSLDRVEVLRGGASHRYGNGALAGVVNLVRENGRERRLDVDAQFGSQRTFEGSAFAQAGQDRWIMRVAADAFSTAGYVTVDKDVRGPIDVPTTAKYLGEEVALEHAWEGGTRLFARGNVYGEKRENGTPLQRNESEIKQLALGFDRPFAAGGAFTFRTYVSDQFFDQTFSAVAADRASEQPTRDQNVPADARGVTASLSWAIGASTLMLGVERARVEATTFETAHLPGRTEETSAHGTQTNLGGFADLALGLGRGGALTLGARYDRWTNSDARRTTPQGTAELPERDASAVSPRIALLLKLGSRLSVTGSAYRAFRAPTLNELYRSFRVGDVVTLANEALDAERVEGTEAGFLVGGRRLSLRATVFRMRTEDTVSSVTLSSAAGLITRQRQNLGSSRSQGVEIDAELRAGIATLQLGWLRADATVRSFEADPSLEGNRLPQVPRSQGTAALRLVGESGRTFALFGRWAGSQFDDDRNLFELGPMRQLDAFLALPLSGSFDLVASGENLLNYRYEIGRTPLPTIAAPRAVRAGVRLRLASLPVVQPD